MAELPEVKKFGPAVIVGILALAFAGVPASDAAPAGAISDAAAVGPMANAVRLNPPAPPAPAVLPAAPASATPAIMQETVDRVNTERAGRGLAPVTYDARLGAAAQAHSQDQAARGQITHTGGDGSTVDVRLDRVGYPWASVAENVAYGSPGLPEVMADWMNSDDHRRNILSANTQIGIGVAYGSDGRPYWTLVLASPR